MTELLTILVPVYRDVDDTRRCLAAVQRTRATADTPTRLVVVDDASPEPELSALLRDLAASEDLELVVNPENRGFTGTVNEAVESAPGDVIVVNSDTVVTPGWIDSLVATANSRPDVATVTPVTNFGSICTLPDSVLPDLETKEDIEGFAARLRSLDLGHRPELISGVGFCMLVRRDAWDVVGPLDEATFGAGYGEEVDFCLRATRLGFVHLGDPSTFVFHAGGSSFGEARRKRRIASSSRILHARYPWFRGVNMAWQRRNPLGPTISALLLDQDPRDPSRPHVLHVLHSSPGATGGTESHLGTLIAGMEDWDATILYPSGDSYVARSTWRVDDRDVTHEFAFPTTTAAGVPGPRDRGAEAAFDLALLALQPDVVHVQNLIGWSVGVPEVAAERGIPVVLSLRDLYAVCPHHWLMYRNVRNCGVPTDPQVCASCLPVTKGDPPPRLAPHREAFTDALAAVDRIVVASQNSGDWLGEVHDVPDERIAYIEHGAIVELDLRAAPAGRTALHDEPLRVAACGQARKKKGIDVVGWVADDVAGDGITVHHFGEAPEEVAASVVGHGAYNGDELVTRLRAAGIQVVLLPATYAETFGHVMTEALLAGCPVIVTEYGALAERVWRHGVGWTVDPEDPEAIAALLRRLDADRDELEFVTRRVESLHIDHTRDTIDDYQRVYDELRRGADPVSLDDDVARHLRVLAHHQHELGRRLDAQASGTVAVQPSGAGSASAAELRQTQKTLRSREREIEDLKDAYAESRKRAREAESRLASLRDRRAVRAALKIASIADRG